jgi:hypothetical protein
MSDIATIGRAGTVGEYTRVLVLIVGREKPQNSELEDVVPFATRERVVMKRLKEPQRGVAGVGTGIQSAVVEVRNQAVVEAHRERNESIPRLREAPRHQEEPRKVMNIPRTHEHLNHVKKCGKPAAMQMSARVTTSTNWEMS